MVGNLADTPFDGQSAILERGRRGARLPLRRQPRFVAGRRPARSSRRYAGAKPQFLALAPWAAPDGPRPALRGVGARSRPEPGASRYVQTAVIADLPFPADRNRPGCLVAGPMTRISRREALAGAAGAAAAA